jgi:hypothetical protein
MKGLYWKRNCRNGLKPGGLIKGGAYLCAGLLYKIVAMELYQDFVLESDGIYVYQFDAFADPLIGDNVFFVGNRWVALDLADRRQWKIICRWKVHRKFPK